MKNKILFIIFFTLLKSHFYSQSSDVVTAQPTIMVIPFAKEKESLRSVYENSEILRIAMTKAKEAFDKRGVNTIDLIAKIKQTNNNSVLQEDQVSDFKDEVIASSGADIYVVVEASKNFSNSGNSANVILTAYDAFSGESLANKTSNSPKIYTDNFEKLVEKAIENEIDNLLNTIQEKFTLILENGRSIVLTVGIENGTSLTMDSEINKDGDLLSELIEDWMEQNSYKSQYHIQGISKNKILFDLVKIPIFGEDGKNFRIRDFTSKFRKYLKLLNFNSSQTIQGNNIVFTISNASK